MKDSLDSEAVRRAVLLNGGNIRKTAREMGVHHPTVLYHLKKANQEHPLTHGHAGADQAHINAYLKKCLDRMGIQHE